MFNLKNFIVPNKDFQRLVYLPLSKKEIKYFCVFGLTRVKNQSRSYWRDFLRIPQKLLKNNESVVVGLLEAEETPQLPKPVMDKPEVIGDGIQCFCVCRVRENVQEVHSDNDIFPEQLIFCRRQEESLSLMQDQLASLVKQNNSIRLKVK